MSKCCDDLDKVLEEAGADHAMHLTNGNKRHRVREVATYENLLVSKPVVGCCSAIHLYLFRVVILYPFKL